MYVCMYVCVCLYYLSPLGSLAEQNQAVEDGRF